MRRDSRAEWGFDDCRPSKKSARFDIFPWLNWKDLLIMDCTHEVAL